MRFTYTSVFLIAASAFVLPLQSGAESPTVPPPSDTPPAEVSVQKWIREIYAYQVQPGYEEWLGSGDGPADSLVSFQLYLTLHPLRPRLNTEFVILYLQGH